MFSYSLKPKKEYNNEYLNISNNITENNNILSIDLKTINFENISVELALNTLQLKHSDYHNMNQIQIIKFYNEKMKLTNNINNILALKIILKHKLKDIDVKINKANGIMFSELNNLKNVNIKNNKNSNTEQKINSIINNTKDNYKIQQVQNNNFKIVQKNVSYNNIKNNSNYSNFINNVNNYNFIELPNNNQNIQSINNNLNKQPFNYLNQQEKLNINNNKENFEFNIKNSQKLNEKNSINNFTINEKVNNINVITSSEFDIDSIINAYSQKKNQGLIK